jgi:glyoxylase-like metal-dependent hydrolase (beta-lactamase superfamily II)
MSDAAPTAGTYALFALRYGIGEGYTTARTYIPTSGFEPPAGDHRLFCYAWVAVSDERTVLVDAGCDEETARARGVTYERSPLDSLHALGVDPLDVDDVVLTHLHWDHAGNLASFPNARVHLHPDELRYATGPAMAHRYLRRPYDVRQLQDVVSLVHDGRVAFTDGVAEIAPGVTVHPLGGHTPGTQIVQVPTERGTVVLASDARHFLHNDAGGDAGGAPFSVVVHVDDYCAASATVDRLAATPDHVVPGHDPAVAHRYPSFDGDELIVRLDTEPKALHDSDAGGAS